MTCPASAPLSRRLTGSTSGQSAGIFTPASASAASRTRWSWAMAWGLKSPTPTCAATLRRFAAYPDAISDADVAIYVQGYQGPQRLTAGFALFRAIPLDVASNERRTGTVDPPILLAFAEYCHATVLPEVAAGLGEAGAHHVETSIITDSGHWVAEEQPAEVAAAIDRFIAAT